VAEPLCFSTSPATASLTHPARDLLLLAMASLSKLLIVALRPDLRVVYVHSLSGDAVTLPLLAWHFVVVQLSDKRTVDPMLAFARDQTVYFVQVYSVFVIVTVSELTHLHSLMMMYDQLSSNYVVSLAM